MRRLLLLLALAVASPFGCSAAADRQALMDAYRRLPELVRDSRQPPQWLASGERSVFWCETGEHAGTFVRIDAARRNVEPILSPRALASALTRLGSGDFLHNPSYRIAADGRRIVFAAHEAVFLLDIATGRLERAQDGTFDALPLTADAAVSPDGAHAAMATGDGILVVRRDGATAFEQANGENIAWRIAEHPWSPDGRRLALWRDDTSGVHKVPIVDYQPIERVAWAPYAKAGTALPVSELYVLDVQHGGARRASATENDYRWLAGWRPDSSALLELQLSRDGKSLQLASIDASTLEHRLLIRETRPATFVAGLDFATDAWDKQVLPLADNRHLVWMSERDGWRHAYLYDYAGHALRQLTRGAFPIAEVSAEIAGEDALLGVAAQEPAHPYRLVPVRIGLDTARMTRLAAMPGVHRLDASPTGRYFVDAYSTLELPRHRDVVDSRGRRFPLSVADVSGLRAIGYASPEPFTVIAANGSTPIEGVLYKPVDFDPRRRYPVIDYIYAGPFTTVTQRTFVAMGEGLEAGGLAQNGFVVVVLDARGTPGRGKAFQDATYGRIGQVEIPDHVAAIRQLAAARPYMDVARAGIVGYSWGGYFAIRGMLAAPEFFKAGYAGASGALEEEAIINEPYMGMPADNPAGYAMGSNLALAGRLTGALKLMHGTSDINATLSTTMRMADALIRAGKPFEMLLMPGQEHALDRAAQDYLAHDIAAFFVRHLGVATEP